MVDLTPQAAAQLESASGLTQSSAPEVPEDLASAMTDGPWMTGDSLDRAFATSGFTGRAFLDTEDSVLVLFVVGGQA